MEGFQEGGLLQFWLTVSIIFWVPDFLDFWKKIGGQILIEEVGAIETHPWSGRFDWNSSSFDMVEIQLKNNKK